MRIAAARVVPVRLRFARPVATARGEFRERESVLLELRNDDGSRGWGEAAPWAGFRTEPVETALARLHALAAACVGADLEPGEGGSALLRGLEDAPAARAALEGALWDLAARRAGRPLAHHLAERLGPMPGAPLRRVPVSALLVEREPEALRAEAGRARAAGHLAVKLKLGTGPLAADLARARALREALGPDLLLRGDANGAWTRAAARDALAALAECHFEYVEQPLAADDVEGLAELRRCGSVRIAADESVATTQDALRLLEAAAVDVLVLKPATLGGPAAALGIARRAREAGTGVVFTHAFESAVGAHHALHCAAAWGDAAAVHGLVTAGLFASDVAVPVAARDGFADVAPVAGLGIDA